MEADYLATDMKAAVAKLQTALRLCKKAKCKSDLLAQTHANLGIVYAAGLNQHSEAVEAFKEALRLAPDITPDPNFVTSGVQKAFDEAKGGGAPKAERGALPELRETAWTEQATFTPVPVYVELPEGVDATGAAVRYRGPGESAWSDVVLEAHATGFGGYIPCSAVQRAGELHYFVTAFDENLETVATAGFAQAPRKVQLVNAVSGTQPALPGADPPATCPRTAPRLTCASDADCAELQTCRNQQCVDRDDVVESASGAATARKRNWLGLLVSPDFMLMQATDDACSVQAQDSGNVGCFFREPSRFDFGLAADQQGGNTISSGFTPLGTLRFLLAYERLLGTRVVAGIRVGYTHFGTPEDFVPLHAEARFAFHFRDDGFAEPGLRPYLFAGGGYGPAAGRVSVEVIDDRNRKHTLDAYQTAGPGFATLGLGAQYAVTPALALVLEVGGRAMLPEFAAVLGPHLGVAYGF
jgi:hypothetical protein